METPEVGGFASPHGGRVTEAQGPSVAHRQRLVNFDRATCTADQQGKQEFCMSPKTKPERPQEDGPRLRHLPRLLARLSKFGRPRQLGVPAPWRA